MSIFDDINLFGSSVDQLLAQKKEKTDITRDLAEKHGAKLPYFAAQFAPGMGIKDAVGEMPGLPPTGAELTDIFSAPNEPSMTENIRSGGLDRYLIAPLQGLGVLGDAVTAVPYAGPVIGAGLKLPGALAAVAGGIGKVKKGITALDETKRMLKADVDAFAKDDTGFVSPTIKALIEKAPANLKGKQITEWLNANANKGVKPKELEYLGFDDYLAANPTATVREAVQGVSGNKVKVTRTSADDTGDNSAPLLEFDVQVSRSDPLDGSSPWDNDIENIKYDIENGDPADLQSYADTYAAGRLTSDEMRTYDNKFTFADMQNRINRELESGASNETLDDVIEEFAEDMYMDNPYQMIQPMTRIGDDNYDNLPAFAYGNDEVGYELFVNGVRKTNPNNVPYSQTEAQIQLRNVMEEDGIGPGRFGIEGEDEFGGMAPRNYQDYVDESLPGGDNYRQVLFRWENAPKGHNATDHFDDPQAIAHALVRDRKLADGTDSLHVDELQSDVHTQGAKYGYDTPENEAKFKPKFEAKEKHIQTEVDRLKPIIQKYVDRYVPPTDLPNLGFPDDIAKGAAIKRTKTEVDNFIKGMKDARGRQRAMIFNDFQKYASNELKFNIPDYDMMDNLKLEIDQSTELSENFLKAVPNYPFKDDWHNMSLQQLVLDAIENGKDTISVSGSVPMIERYSDKYATFYQTLYDKKIPSAMKKLANKYGGKFEKGSLDEIDTFGKAEYIEDGSRVDDIRQGDFESDLVYSMDPSDTKKFLDGVEPKLEANILRITPEMKAKVLEEGFPGFALGGEVSTKGIKALRFKKIVIPKEEDRGIGSL